MAARLSRSKSDTQLSLSPEIGTKRQSLSSDIPRDRPSLDHADTQPLPLEVEHFANTEQPRKSSIRHKNSLERDGPLGWVFITDITSSSTPTSETVEVKPSRGFHDKKNLEMFFDQDLLKDRAPLRLIQVQNASWACDLLRKNFNLPADEDLATTLFGCSQSEGSTKSSCKKSASHARASGVHVDLQRGVKRVALKCDYLQQYDPSKSSVQSDPWLSLKCYNDKDEEVDGKIYLEHISAYVQTVIEQPRSKEKAARTNPHASSGCYDGNTIIIFSETVEHMYQGATTTFLPQKDKRWTELLAQLARSFDEADNNFVTHSIDNVLESVFQMLVSHWNRLLTICAAQVNILEDKVTGDPYDGWNVSEIWTVRANLMSIGRLMNLQSNVARSMWSRFKKIAPTEIDDLDDFLLDDVLTTFDRLTEDWDKTVFQRTAALSDMMFQLNAFQDSRNSLALGRSMARLSWITFIFLPLSFTVGVFGMNVKTFESNPPIKWWIVTSVVTFCLVLLMLFALQRNMASERATPSQQARVWEMWYGFLAKEFKDLWTETGPNPEFKPGNRREEYEWQLVRKWFPEDKLKKCRQVWEPKTEYLGMRDQIKLIIVMLSSFDIRDRNKEKEKSASCPTGSV